MPAELRNRIYRETFLNESVNITSNIFPEPALLLVCRQVRGEASSIFYAERKFLVNVSSFITKATLVYKQKAVVVAMTFGVEMSYEAMIYPGHGPSWQNVVIACRRVHKGYPLTLEAESAFADGIPLRTVAITLEAVKEWQNTPWSGVEVYLEDIHETLVNYDPRWM